MCRKVVIREEGIWFVGVYFNFKIWMIWKCRGGSLENGRGVIENFLEFYGGFIYFFFLRRDKFYFSEI